MKKKIKHFETGSTVSREPRLVGDIVMDMFKGWSHNTELSVDLKTILSSDPRAKAGKDYQGVLRRDVDCDEYRYDEHFTFVEAFAPKERKRNPHVFIGQYITVTRRDDGTYRLNFCPIKTGAGFSLETYALGVYNEICMALGGLIE
jgi:hypothetical protein